MSLMKITVTETPKTFGQTGTFCKLVKASGLVRIRFVFHDESELETDLYQGLAIDHPKAFKSMFISAETPQEITLFASPAKLVDDRLETSITGAATLNSSKSDLLAGEVSQVLDERLGRRSALIFCDVATYIGGANVTIDTGILVDAGSSIEINSQAAVFGITSSDSSVRILEEIN